ncbi:MAG: hypothetical protein PUB85_02050 [Clostridia bacterium]|nr:hypothetical protein [Oscillospiraceae bacterium]MDD6219764.1 hypothetical protein [Clostridia bacterium]
MNSKLLNKKKIPPACEYCSRGTESPDGKSVLCPKKGVMRRSSSCRSFQYDPLKRRPKLPMELPEFDPSDFEL